MKFILLIIFTIMGFFINSYLGVNTQTEPIKVKRNFRIENVEVSKDHRKHSESEPFGKSVSNSETGQGEDSIFELVFFLITVIFTAFLVILHFYGQNEKIRKYKQFDRNLLKQRQITDRCLLTQSCD